MPSLVWFLIVPSQLTALRGLLVSIFRHLLPNSDLIWFVDQIPYTKDTYNNPQNLWIFAFVLFSDFLNIVSCYD